MHLKLKIMQRSPMKAMRRKTNLRHRRMTINPVMNHKERKQKATILTMKRSALHQNQNTILPHSNLKGQMMMKIWSL
jgi:hypothetical protein